MSEMDWADIARRLQEPFDPADVEFRPQGTLNDQGQGRAIAYVDARVVAARLDAVVGPQNWAFDWQPVILDNAVRVVKGTITIYGVPKSDIGDGDKTEPSKAAVSDALKRTAVLWGPGRYLYSLEAEWVKGKQGSGSNWYIPDAELTRLRGKLPRPTGMPAPVAAAPPAPSAPQEPPADLSDKSMATDAQIFAIRGLTAKAGLTPDGLLEQLGVQSLSALTHKRAQGVINRLTERAKERGQVAS